jgi:hypothetical protein
VDKLLRMVDLNPSDFQEAVEVVVRHQIWNYVRNVRDDLNFVKF